MIIERTFKERTKDKSKVVVVAIILWLPSVYLITQHNFIMNVLGFILVLGSMFIGIPICMALSVNTDYYKVVPDKREET